MPKEAFSSAGPASSSPTTRAGPRWWAAPVSFEKELRVRTVSSTVMRRKAATVFLAVFLAGLLAALNVPSGGSAPAPRPHPVTPEVHTLPLAGVDRAALAELRGQDPDADPAVLTPPRATETFKLLGVSWTPTAKTPGIEVQIRTRGGKGWSSWSELEIEDVFAAPRRALDPSDDSADTRAGTEPMYSGPSSGVQVRVDLVSGELPGDLQVSLVDPGTSVADSSVTTLADVSAGAQVWSPTVTRPPIVTRAQWGADESLRNGFAVRPARILDTRTGLGTTAGLVLAGSSRSFQVTGRGGVPASGVGTVVLNVTAIKPNRSGYLTVYPSGRARPPTPNLNYPGGRTTDNLVHVPVGGLGKVSLYAGSADVNVVADVLGWTSNGGATLQPGEGLLHPTAPIRVLDTRKTSALGPGVARSFKVTGTGGSAGVPPGGHAQVQPRGPASQRDADLPGGGERRAPRRRRPERPDRRRPQRHRHPHGDDGRLLCRLPGRRDATHVA